MTAQNNQPTDGKMRVLIFEDEFKPEMQQIRDAVKKRVEVFGGNSQRVRGIREALEFLAQQDVDLVIVHHYDFSDVNKMREKFPNVKYAGYSGNLYICLETAHIKRSGGAIYLKEFGEHYDYSIYDVGRSLDECLRDVRRTK